MAKISIKELINYWIKNSKDKWSTAKILLESKKYSDSLFFCHLALECLLKGLVCSKTKKRSSLYTQSNQTGRTCQIRFKFRTERFIKNCNHF